MGGEESFTMLAKTLYGLEDLLVSELQEIGATDIRPGRRMVAFTGTLRTLYKANVFLRTALRILVPIDQFDAKNPDEIYDHLYNRVDWSRYFQPRDTFAVDTVVYSNTFTHSKFVAYRVKDAIADYFRDKEQRRPNVSVTDPDLCFHIHIADERVTLTLDASGESLHKRGYRLNQTEAPINEVLAAGILLRAGWKGQCDFLDPMCGSGTFLIEAALIAANIPPGLFRERFAFERWSNFDEDLFTEVMEDWEERVFEHKIYGSDSNPKAIAMSRGNVRKAGVERYVDLAVRRIEDYDSDLKPAETGLLVTNPPYGERLRPEALEELYQKIGSTLKHTFAGWNAWIISSNIEEGFNAIGLKHFHKETLYNGALECELRGYELFAGKRNDYVQEQSEKGVWQRKRDHRMRQREEREDFRRSRKTYRKKQ